MFGEAAYSADTQTALKQLGANKHYTLESIVYCWKYHSEPHNTYVREVSTRGVETVTLLQRCVRISCFTCYLSFSCNIFRNKLVEHLRGEREELEGIDLNAPVAVPILYSTLIAEAEREKKAERERHEPAAKRPRVDEMCVIQNASSVSGCSFLGQFARFVDAMRIVEASTRKINSRWRSMRAAIKAQTTAYEASARRFLLKKLRSSEIASNVMREVK